MTRMGHARLEKEVAEFLSFKRTLGYKYSRAESVLRRLLSFAADHFGENSRIDLEVAVRAWLQRHPGPKPYTLTLDLGSLRQFCLYLRRSDPSAFVPPLSLVRRARSSYVPYVFSHDEIRQLISAAAVERPRRSNFWSDALRMLLVVMYCTGLRPGEATRLQLSDIDQLSKVLHIRETKGRSRDLPFQEDLAEDFTRYLRKRSELLRTKGLEQEPALFVNLDGRAVTINAASSAICRLLRRLGMKSLKGRSGPRPYDLRHTFAVHRLTAWYHEGVDLQAHLPWLSAYMGHLNLLGTETYLHATPELLDLASKRFSERFSHSGDHEFVS